MLDVHLWDINEVKTTIIPPDASLRFLSNVHVPSIPLCLIVGPPLQVSTENLATIEWLHESFDVEAEYPGRIVDNGHAEHRRLSVSRQLPNGVLLGLETSLDEKVVTEVLFYAEIHQFQQGDSSVLGSPSPGTLSNDRLRGSTDVPPVLVIIYALPLCSDILSLARKASDNATEASMEASHPMFLEDGRIVQTSTQKRQRLSNLFDDASQQRRKLKSRGGEGVSKAVSGVGWASDPRNHAEKVIGHVGVKQHSRRPSTATSLPESVDTQPVACANDKRSSLRRVQSAISPRQLSVVSKNEDDYASQNKAALTKMVMTGMRLHGLQQRKKGASVADKSEMAPRYDNSLSVVGLLDDRDDEYKLIYHQTFKAALFAFRRNLSERVLDQYHMHDVVDRLLMIFCTDPTSLGGPPTASSQSLSTCNKTRDILSIYQRRFPKRMHQSSLHGPVLKQGSGDERSTPQENTD